jgi:hypothetical protein
MPWFAPNLGFPTRRDPRAPIGPVPENAPQPNVENQLSMVNPYRAWGADQLPRDIELPPQRQVPLAKEFQPEAQLLPYELRKLMQRRR